MCSPLRPPLHILISDAAAEHRLRGACEVHSDAARVSVAHSPREILHTLVRDPFDLLIVDCERLLQLSVAHPLWRRLQPTLWVLSADLDSRALLLPDAIGDGHLSGVHFDVTLAAWLHLIAEADDERARVPPAPRHRPAREVLGLMSRELYEQAINLVREAAASDPVVSRRLLVVH